MYIKKLKVIAKSLLAVSVFSLSIGFLLKSSQRNQVYDVSASCLVAGGTFYCHLEPSNAYDSNCIALWVDSHSMLWHVPRANYLAPLLRVRQDFETSG